MSKLDLREIDLYKWRYSWSLEGIPAVTEEQLKIEKVIEDKEGKGVSALEAIFLKWVEFLKTANTMKEKIWDKIDDINQNRIAFETMDIYTWKKEDLKKFKTLLIRDRNEAKIKGEDYTSIDADIQIAERLIKILD